MYNEYRAEIFRSSQLICMLLSMHFFSCLYLSRFAVCAVPFIQCALSSDLSTLCISLFIFFFTTLSFCSNGDCIWRLFFVCASSKRFVNLIRCVVIIQLVYTHTHHAHTMCANVYQMKFAYTAKYWILNSSNKICMRLDGCAACAAFAKPTHTSNIEKNWANWKHRRFHSLLEWMLSFTFFF